MTERKVEIIDLTNDEEEDEIVTITGRKCIFHTCDCQGVKLITPPKQAFSTQSTSLAQNDKYRPTSPPSPRPLKTIWEESDSEEEDEEEEEEDFQRRDWNNEHYSPPGSPPDSPPPPYHSTPPPPSTPTHPPLLQTKRKHFPLRIQIKQDPRLKKVRRNLKKLL